MRLGCIEHALPERLGRVQSLEILWVRIADGLEQLVSKTWHLIVGRNPKEGRESAEFWDFISLREPKNIAANEEAFD